MIRTRSSWLALAVLTLAVAPPAFAVGPIHLPCSPDKPDCPPPSYSPINYWAPTWVRVKACFHHERISVEPPDRHPEIAPTYVMQRYPCPTVSPAEFSSRYGRVAEGPAIAVPAPSPQK